jgi:hypothetical protein
LGAWSLEGEVAAVQIDRRARLGCRLGGEAREERPEEAARLAVRGSIGVEDELLPLFGALGRDGDKHLLREPLHGPARTERGTKKVGDGVVGGNNGITSFVRLCHSARSSLSPHSSSNRISPLRAKPAAIGSE